MSPEEAATFVRMRESETNPIGPGMPDRDVGFLYDEGTDVVQALNIPEERVRQRLLKLSLSDFCHRLWTVNRSCRRALCLLQS